MGPRRPCNYQRSWWALGRQGRATWGDGPRGPVGRVSATWWGPDHTHLTADAAAVVTGPAKPPHLRLRGTSRRCRARTGPTAGSEDPRPRASQSQQNAIMPDLGAACSLCAEERYEKCLDRPQSIHSSTVQSKQKTRPAAGTATASLSCRYHTMARGKMRCAGCDAHALPCQSCRYVRTCLCLVAGMQK